MADNVTVKASQGEGWGCGIVLVLLVFAVVAPTIFNAWAEARIKVLQAEHLYHERD